MDDCSLIRCANSFPGVCQIQVSFANPIVNSTLYFFLEMTSYSQTMRGVGDSLDIDQLVGNSAR